VITFYGFGRVHPAVFGETRDLRVQWALEEVGLPYRVHGVDHTGGEHNSAEYTRISCFNQLPAIDDDGFIVAESAAVLLYLAEKSGKLLPNDLQGRTRVIQWCFASLATIETPLQNLLLFDSGGFGEFPKDLRSNIVAWANRTLAGAERRLEGREWIACDEFTVADMLLACVLREIRNSDLMRQYPRLQDFYARALSRPSWQRALELYAERLGANVADIR
jgi:glutathione S-transferase